MLNKLKHHYPENIAHAVYGEFVYAFTTLQVVPVCVVDMIHNYVFSIAFMMYT